MLDNAQRIDVIIISGIIFVYFFFVIAQYFAHRRFNYLQETSVAIVLGVIIGAILFYTTNIYESQFLNGNTMKTIIFLVLLPPIMFEDGYNFPRKKFMQNIFYINMFGLIGTIINFILIYFILTAFNNAKFFLSVSDQSTPIVLLNWQILLTSACLCSIEPIVSEKVLNKERFPKLFSITFGEALFKDTFSITMFDSIINLVQKNGQNVVDIEGQQVGQLILRFLLVIFGSILIGIIIGLLTTIIFKNWRFLLEEKGISQMALTILSGYLGYMISQTLQFSGVVSMIFCGTILSHYNSYNMTKEGKQVTKITIETLKIMMSGIIFFFIGFYIFNVQSFISDDDESQTKKSNYSLSLLGVTFLALFVARFVNVYVMAFIAYLIQGKQKWRLNIYELPILFAAGMIHGAVPFALIITMPGTTAAENCTEANIVSVVLITSFLFNMFIPKFQKVMIKKIGELWKRQPHHPSLKQSLISDKPITESLLISKVLKAESNLHFFKRIKNTTQKYWRKCEEGCLKPILIYDYYQRKQLIRMEKIKERVEQYDRYVSRYQAIEENYLNVDNEEANKFVDIQLSDSSGSSDQEGNIIKIRKQPSSKNQKQIKKRESQTQIMSLNKALVDKIQIKIEETEKIQKSDQ